MSQTASISVLHVDDDSAFADLTAEMLERESKRVEVTTVSSVSDGLDELLALVLRRGIDCLVADRVVPFGN